MRILVADQNALLLAAITATFGRHCEIVTATRRDACIEHMEHRPFDVVVACEKLADYTGLELLSEVEAVSPPTLRIFAARPETLQRLGRRLDFFGLIGTLSYPIEARKLLVALKVARGRLRVPRVVRHVVLENEWDTGERLALLGQELEDTPEVTHDHRVAQAAAAAAIDETTEPWGPDRDEPAAEVWAAGPEASTALGASAFECAAVERARHIAEASSFDVSFEVSFDENPNPTATASNDVFAEEPPPAAASKEPLAEERPPASAADEQGYVDSGSANDEAFSPGAPAASSAPRPAASKLGTTKGPRPRKPTVPTAAQREAFQRALARRNAARAGGIQPPSVDFSALGGMSPTRPAAQPAARSSESLSDLARMATTKRPLPGARRGTQPKRRVFVVGSGIAAVLLVGVVSFELLGANSPSEHGRAASAQLFSPRSTLDNTSASPPPVFSPPSPQPLQTAPSPAAASGLLQPQAFDPNTAPPDPPPPPALERPGPMEPPSMAHNGPPLGMQGAPESQ